MLRGNLSTRPFYNERLVLLMVAIGAVLGLALTVFNAAAIYRLSGERSSQQAELDRIEDEAAKSTAAANAMRGSLDAGNLRTLAGATNEANALIDQRTFSWTAFFDLVEKTLPLDARLVAVAPRIERGNFMIQMQLNVRRPEDLEVFIENLLGTGTFYDLLPGDQQRNDDGTLLTTLLGGYLAPASFGPPSKASSRRGTDRP
jgi:hypothetical protein